ncbi:MAG: M48 family metallopeptidase [Alphaproteobacteria bacterium]|nr:M48 family metallopeptidase [Alphaproteobacteria bacterium SS10]
MVEYSNPIPPDHMNRGKDSGLRDLMLLGIGGLGLLVAVMFGLMLLGGAVGRMIPFSYELAVVEHFAPQAVTRPDSGRALELQELADRLARHMRLPEDMRITVHYDNDPQVNAFATVGGQVIILGGLLSNVKSENELAMVMAHEIAHIKNRDVAANLFGAAIMALFYTAFFGGEGVSTDIFQGAGGLLRLGFSREAERQADADALRALVREYGHANGAVDLFETLDAANIEAGGGLLNDFEMLRTHPSIDKRIAAVKELANELEAPLEGPLAPLSNTLGSAPSLGKSAK